MKDALQQFTTRSAMKYALVLNISDRSTRRVLKIDLKIHPYIMLVTHQLTERDLCTCKEQCLEMQQQIPSFATVLLRDEAQFHLCGGVSKQNLYYWAETNAQKLYERLLHSSKVTVWCAISDLLIWGPYSFEVNTVNTDRYCQIL